MMRTGLLVATSLLTLAEAGPSLAQDPEPGTVRLLSDNARNEIALRDGSTEVFVALDEETPAKFLVIGPVTIQVDYRVHLQPGEGEREPTVLTVYRAGRPWKRYRVTPRPSRLAQPFDDTGLLPSNPVGFYLPLGPGTHVLDVRAQLAGAAGASIFLVDAREAHRNLAQPPPDPPTESQPVTEQPAPDPEGDDDPTPSSDPGPSPRETPTPDEDPDDAPVVTPTAETDPATPAAGGIVAGEEPRLERYPWSVRFAAGALASGPTSSSVRPLTRLVVRRGLADVLPGLSAGLSVGATRTSWEAPHDPDRAVSPALVNLEILPVQGHVFYHLPGVRRVQPFAALGGGAAAVRSELQEIQLRIQEKNLGFAASAGAGIEIDFHRDLAATEVESQQRIVLQLSALYTTAQFAAHDEGALLAAGLLAGVAFNF